MKPLRFMMFMLAISMLAIPAAALNFSDNGRWKANTSLDTTSINRGDAVKLSWSVPKDGSPISWPAWKPANSSLKEFLDKNSCSEYMKMFRFIFGRVGEVSGLQFVESLDDGSKADGDQPGIAKTRGDVRVVASDLSRIDYPCGACCNMPNPNKSCILHINTGRTTSYNEMLWIVMHEVGHAVGFAHQTIWESPTATSEYRTASGGFGSITGFQNSDGPQFDDVYSMHRMYGDKWERNGGNDKLKTATTLGDPGDDDIVLGAQIDDLAIAPTESDFLSIDGASDRDNFKFKVAKKSNISIKITPKGPTYDFAPEGGKRKTFEASKQNDLFFDLCNSKGVSLAHVNKGGLGEIETVTKTLPGGSYYLIVSGSKDACQFYRLDVWTESL